MTIWAEVEVDHHQFYLSPLNQSPTDVDQSTDVFEAGQFLISVRTGISTGPVEVGLSLLSSSPPDDYAGWENVAQVALKVSEPLHIITLQGEVVENLGPVTAPPSKLLAIRVSTTGRGLNWDGIVDEATERYLIEIWPTDRPQRATQLKSVDGMWAEPSVVDRSATGGAGTEDASARLFGFSQGND